MKNAKTMHDIGMPIYDGMWCYRPGWENAVETIANTAAGDNSTVYRFDLCSHTGTYIETSQHKLVNDIQLSEFETSDFVRNCKVISLAPQKAGNEITLAEFEFSLRECSLEIGSSESIIIATGWGRNHRDRNYLSACPFFAKDLVDWLCNQKLHLLGVDTPVIDNPKTPFGAVQRLFEANSRMLLIAPLVIDPLKVKSGNYLLCGAPLKIESVSASLCRPILIETPSLADDN